MKCHDIDGRKPVWERDKQIIENITSNIHGIDINPFATFLTTTNLTFLLIENYSIVRHKYPGYSLEFNVVTHDALARSPPATQTLPTENGRMKEAVRRSEKYAKLCNNKYGIKKVIRERTGVQYLIDMGILGSILFPQKTNYPAITVLRNAASKEDPIVVEVTEN
jgi:hypothetical protein